ncbi:MAG: hypothetical protein R3Y22_02680 [Bacteroidales bacterium]
MKRIKKIWNELLGYRYYAVTINDNFMEYISSNIFDSYTKAEEYYKSLNLECKTLQATEIISFRSKRKIIL